MSDPGYVLCVGWRADAGQCGLVSVFLNVTASPGLILIMRGLNPEEVICTTFLLSTGAGSAVTGVSAGAAVTLGCAAGVSGWDDVVSGCGAALGAQALTNNMASANTITIKVVVVFMPS